MRILVVDDERDYGFLLFNILARMGHDPVLAFDAEEALAILDDRASSVRGVITDIDMPGMTGVQLAERIHERIDRDMPIAFCTGSDPGAATTKRAASIGPVLTKGGSLVSAREVIAQMIDLWSRPAP